MKDNYVITISRQFGSLGRPIAQKMSKKLGIEFYDRDIVDEAAKKLELPVSSISKQEETSEKIERNSFFRMAFPLGKKTKNVQDDIFHTQEKIIKFLVERESCIVVGRCSDFILSEHPNSAHIHIYAPFEDRVKNSIEKLGISKEQAAKMVYEVDEAREAYHLHYAGFKPDDKQFKDIMVNSSFLGLDGTADFLVEAVKRKFNL